MSAPLRLISCAKWARKRLSIRSSGSKNALLPNPISNLPPTWRSSEFARYETVMSAHMQNHGAGPVISDEDFLKFKEYFYRRTGINFESSKRYFVDKRLSGRIAATSTDTFRNYFTFLRFQASERSCST